MKTKVTYRDLVKMHPCYHPNEIGIKNGYSATIPDFIREYRDKVKDKADIIWVICRKDYMTDKDMRLFAVWCAREALKLVSNPAPESINACDVAERYANGKATDEDLGAARSAAGYAAWDAAGYAAWSAAGYAAWDAAGYAAWYAARSAAWYAAGYAQVDKLLTYFE